MYNRLIKKNYLYKIFSLSLPKKKKSNSASYYLCKYIMKNTPYGNFSFFIKEINNLITLFISNSNKKKILFICANKIFFWNLKEKKYLFYLNRKTLSLLKIKIKKYQISFVLWYNCNYRQKITAYLKDRKLPSIGFIDFHNQPNITDYTLLLENKFFSSIFIFHFILKKVLLNVKN